MSSSYDSYIICGTPRTGSTLLCNLLTASGVAGQPDSFFMPDIDPIWLKQWGFPSPEGRGSQAYCAAYLKAAIAEGRGQTGIFGLRLMRENLPDLLAMIRQAHPALPSDKARLQAAFGRILYVHLTREDKLSQAISMVKAEQTGLWHIAPDGSELERLSPPKAPEYDFFRIKAKMDALQRYDATWLTWFTEQGIAPLKITYESLSKQPEQTAMALCRHLGVRPAAQTKLAPGVAKLADLTSRDWAARYRADAAAT